MKKLIFTILAFFTAFNAFSQSADFIEKMLSTSQATYTNACYISAVTQGLASENSTFEDAFNALYENGQISKNINKETELTYEKAAELFAKMWHIKGGLMFKITKGSARYAFKQMKSDGIINQEQNPSATLSGTELLNFYTKGTNFYFPEDLSSDFTSKIED